MTARSSPRSPSSRIGPGFENVLGRLDEARVSFAVLALVTLLGIGVLFHMTRGTSFWFDEWVWITGRRASSVGNFLQPYNVHLSLVPIALYRVMFAVFGLHDYAPYRLLGLAGHASCAVLVFVYARPRVGGLAALLATVLILFLGPGWQDILWPFQLTWTIAMATGIAAYLMLDQRRAWCDVAACLLLTLSVASTSLGVAIALGVAIDIALTRRRMRDAWIVVIPLALYAIWVLAYHPKGIIVSEIFQVPSLTAQALAGALSSLTGLAGLSGVTPAASSGTALEFGVPLTAVALAAGTWLVRRRGVSARAVSLASVLLVFSVLTTLGRGFAGALVSRYLYVECIFVVLLAVELIRGLAWTPRAALAAILVVVLISLSNFGAMRSSAQYLRSQGAITTADLTALDLSRPYLPKGYIARAIPGFPFILIRATSYFSAERALGTPADTLAELLSAQGPAQAAADTELIQAGEITLSPASAGHVATGSSPRIESASGGAARTGGSCLTFTAAPASQTGNAQIAISVPATGLTVSSRDAALSVQARRFAPTFQPLGTLAPDHAAQLTVRQDAAQTTWHLQLTTTGRANVCTAANS
jgi:hypothetical protein